MNKPILMPLHSNVLNLFINSYGDTFKGRSVAEIGKAASEMWQALTEEDQIAYKAKWNKIKADFQTDVAEWEEKNADNPKMTELKAYKNMLETANKLGSF